MSPGSKERIMPSDYATARTGLFALAEYAEPPRDLRRALTSLVAGLGVYGMIVLGMAIYG